MAFVLTALFVVLTIEQYFNSRARFPFVAAIRAGSISLLLFSPNKVLLASIILGTLVLMGRERIVKENTGINKRIKKPYVTTAQPVKVKDNSQDES